MNRSVCSRHIPDAADEIIVKLTNTATVEHVMDDCTCYYCGRPAKWIVT